MTVSSGNVVLKKDTQNLIGISIGGGAPLCPCLYVVQIFDNTPAAKDNEFYNGWCFEILDFKEKDNIESNIQ
jgi:hypothetical protein